MKFIDWLIVFVPLAGILYAAYYSRRYAHSVVNFLAAGRVVDVNAPEQFAAFFGKLSFHDGHPWAERPGQVVLPNGKTESLPALSIRNIIFRSNTR